MLWVLKTPTGALIKDTVRPTQSECWEWGFRFVSQEVSGFEAKYWKRWDASIAAAKRLGYRMVKVSLEEVR